MKRLFALASLTAGICFPWIGKAQNTTNLPIISVSPSSCNWGLVATYTTNDRPFTVQNVGGGVLTGKATVPTGPFSIVGSGAYSLAQGSSQVVTIRYRPIVVSTNDVRTVSFTGGGGAAVIVKGAAQLAAPKKLGVIGY